MKPYVPIPNLDLPKCSDVTVRGEAYHMGLANLDNLNPHFASYSRPFSENTLVCMKEDAFCTTAKPCCGALVSCFRWEGDAILQDPFGRRPWSRRPAAPSSWGLAYRDG